MYNEVLNFKPQLDPSDLRKMEKSLASRFAAVTKKFGKGLLAGLTGGGLAGVGLSILERMLNPLKETQDAIDRTLKTAGDVVSNANQFGTTAGRLYRLQALAGTKGLDPGELYAALGKFQTAVAEARIDPTKPTAVRQFVGIQDTAEGFYEFIQALQKLPKDLQIAAQQEIFGEKAILRLADFLNSNQRELADDANLPDSTRLDFALKKGDRMSTMAQMLEARRNAEDMIRKLGVGKGGLINEGMVTARDAQLRAELEKENNRIANYQNLMKIEQTSSAILGLLEKSGLKILNEILGVLKNASSIIDKIPGLRALKGLTGQKDK